VADRDSKSFRVRISVLGGGGRLPANGYARAVVHVGTRPNTLAVSKDAVLSEAGDKFVWLIDGENTGKDATYKAKRQPITVGLTDARYTEVLSGLKEGDRVIAAGSPAIIDGTPISVAGGWTGGAGDAKAVAAAKAEAAKKANAAPRATGEHGH
jgi:hypothetical protein